MIGKMNKRLEEALEVLAGFRGSKDSHAVRVRDLEDLRSKLAGSTKLSRKASSSNIRLTKIIGDDATQEGTLRFDIAAALAQADEVGRVAAENAQKAQEVSAGLEGLTDGFTGKLSDAFDQVDEEISNEISGIARRIGSQDVQSNSVTQALDSINQRLAWLLTNASATNSRITDAGIYVDQESGTVRIAAVQSQGQKISDTEIRLNAAEANINLRATQGYVNQAVASAVLDPSQIPFLDGLIASVSNVEIDLDAVKSSIELKADKTEINGFQARISTAEVTVDALGEEVALKASSTELAELEARTTTAETAINTIDGGSITQTVQDTRFVYQEVVKDKAQNLREILEAYEARQRISQEIAFATQDLRAKIESGGRAVATLTSSLEVQIDSNAAVIESVRKTQVSDEEAFAGIFDALQADIDGVSSSLTNSYFTKAETGAAISNASTSLKSALEGEGGSIKEAGDAIASVSADLTNNYLTKTLTEGAIAAAETRLSADVTQLRGTVQGYGVVFDTLDAIIPQSPRATLTGVAAVGQSTTILVRESGLPVDPSGSTDAGAVVQIDAQFALQFGGKRVKVSVLARKPDTSAPVNFGIAYSTASNGHSGVIPASGPFDTQWRWFDFYYDVPVHLVNTGNHFVGIYGALNGGNKRTEVARMTVQVAAEAQDLPEITQLSGQISDVKGLDLNALDGTAFGTMLEELSVSSNGRIAGIENFGSVMADLKGRTEAAFVLRAKAGSASGALEVAAWDDVDGSGSAITLEADLIFAKGTFNTNLLSVGNAAQILQNSDYAQGLLHIQYRSGTVAGFIDLSEPNGFMAGLDYPTLRLRTDFGSPRSNVRIAANFGPDARDGSARSGYPVKEGEWYEWQAQVSAVRASVAMRVRWIDKDGVTFTASTAQGGTVPAIGQSDNPEQWERVGGLVQAPAGAAFAVPRVDLEDITESGAYAAIWTHKPFFGKTVEGAQLSIYGSGSTTLITGRGIATRTITAENMNVVELSAIAANIGLLRSATSGERVEIEDDRIQVFDSNNAVRVRIGRLS